MSAPIRSLDIGPRDRWVRGRLPIHIAHATAPEPTLSRPKPKRAVRPWFVIVGVLLILMIPPLIALSAGSSWQVLRRLL